MILDLHQLLILGIFCASIHWIFARSKIMKPLWSRARGVLASWLACPACFGMWVGIALGFAGLRPVAWYCVEEMTFWSSAIEIAQVGLLATFLTPVFEGILVWGLETSAIQEAPTSRDPGEHEGVFDAVDEG